MVACALVLAMLPLPVSAEEPPPTPHRFYGQVKSPGGEPAPDGLVVSAWVGDEEKGSSPTSGGQFRVDVEASEGDTVYFKVQGVEPEETQYWRYDPEEEEWVPTDGTWELGGITKVDLIVSFAGDVTAPDVPSLVYPADGAYLSQNLFTFDWEDSTDPSGVAYDIQVDTDDGFAAPLIIDDRSTRSEYAVSTALADDTYYWRVRAVDGALNASGWTATWSFTVDTVAPSITVVALSPDPTSDSTPTLTGTADGTGSPVASVQYRLDDGPWSAAQAVDGVFDEASEEYTFTTPALDDGSHTVQVRATDAAGNTTDAADYASDDFEVDTAAPSVSITPLTPDPTSNNTPTFTGTAWDTPSTWISAVHYRIDAGDWTAAEPVDGAFDELTEDYRFTTDTLADGTHTVEVRATDAAGNVTPPEGYASDTFTIDATAPAISSVHVIDITTSRAAACWSTDEPGSSQVVYGTTSHSGDISTAEAARTVYGSWSAEADTDPRVRGHSIYLSGLEQGTTYYYRVVSIDALGNEAVSAEYSFTTQEDSTGPEITDVTVSNITTSGAIVLWTTDEVATSQVEYGTASAAHGAYPWTTPLDPALVMSHGMSIGGLAPGTTYYFRVISVDAFGNEAWSEEYSFATLADTSQPAISGVNAGNITSTGAVITWSTDEPATSQVKYGTTEGGPYTVTTPLDPSLVYAHSVALSGLTTDTTYYFRVISRDAYGNEAESDEYSFTTAADTTAPVISDVSAGRITDVRAVVSWNTDEPATTQVEYGTSEGGPYPFSTTLNPALVLTHGAVLAGLSPDTTYYYRALSSDAYGNGAVSDEQSFTTLGDTTPPVISAVIASNVTDSSVIIFWSTNEPATSQVEYGTTDAYGSSTTFNSSLVYLHGVVISGLNPDTTYHFRVRSQDGASPPNEALSGDYTFTTEPDSTRPLIWGVTATDITGTSVVIRWTTNETSTSQVEYGLTDTYGSESLLNPNPVRTHSVMLVGLTPGTTYHYRVKSADALGNEAISGDFAFDTVADETPPTISGVEETNVTTSSAVILWLTSEPATSQVVYTDSGPVTDPGWADSDHVRDAYGTWTDEDSTLVTNHGVVLTGLTGDVTYYYRVISRDGTGHEAWSDEYTFHTSDATPPAVLWVDAVAVTGSSAVIAWTTDEDAISQVVYSTTSHAGNSYGSTAADADNARTGYGSVVPDPEDGTLLRSHAVVLTGLTSGTTYYYRVISHDAAGNYVISEEYSFTTA